MPKLRFPKFYGEWKTVKLGDIGTFTKGAALSKADISETGTPFILYGELYTTYSEVTYKIQRKTDKNAPEICYSQIGDVIIPTSGETPKEIATATCVMLPNVILAGDLNIYRASTVDGRIISYIINHVINGKIAKVAQGKSVVHVKADEIGKISINYPNSDEQSKIIAFLELLDRRIDKQRQFIESLKSYKRGVVFSVFKTNNQFNIPTNLIPLRSLLTEHRNRDTNDLRVCSVAVNKGVVDQIEHLGRSFAATDTSNYGRVRYGDVIYTKSPTGSFPYGIVKQSHYNEDVAVSPLYGVYEPRNFEIGFLLHIYFEQHENANNYIKPLAQKGAKNTINITNNRFLDGKIIFPALHDDIIKLQSLFCIIDEKIKVEEKLLEMLTMQKNSLLSKMFI